MGERRTVLGIVAPYLPKREVGTTPRVVSVEPEYVELYATARGVPHLRFRNLKGFSPWWPIYERGKPNPLVVTMVSGDLLTSDLDDSKESIETAIKILAREAIRSKDFKVSDDTLLVALRKVFEKAALEKSIRMTTRQIEQAAIIEGKRDGADVEAWKEYNAFTDEILMRIAMLEQLGIRVVDLDHKEGGRTFAIELLPTNEAYMKKLVSEISEKATKADEADEIRWLIGEEMRESLRAIEPGVYLVIGVPEATSKVIDVLTHLVVCENPEDGRPCGKCVMCQLYHYADKEMDSQLFAVPTLYLDGARIDEDRVALERSKFIAAKRVLIVVESYERMDDEAKEVLDKWIVEDNRNIWIVAGEGAAMISEEIADRVKFLHTC